MRMDKSLHMLLIEECIRYKKKHFPVSIWPPQTIRNGLKSKECLRGDSLRPTAWSKTRPLLQVNTGWETGIVVWNGKSGDHDRDELRVTLRWTLQFNSSSSIGTATLVGCGLLNYRWVFSAGRFLQSAVASGTSNPQLGGPVIRTFQLPPPGVPHV